MAQELGKSLDEFISFNRFITKDIMSFVYMIGAIILILLGITEAVFGRVIDPTQSVEQAWTIALIILIPGNIAWRIACEYIVGLLKINESLMNMDSKLEG